jgi:5-methylcytosine-specific restriction endonuclease McrA
MRRDDFKCRICGRSPATHPGLVLHVDHVEAWSKGGSTVMENLQTLCEQDNIGKSNLSMKKEEKG